MTLNAKAKQKKMTKKAAKRKTKLKEKNASLHLSPQEKTTRKIARSLDYPIYQCLIPTKLFEYGIGHLIFARRLSNDRIGIAAFLVDVLALGIKDCYYDEVPEATYHLSIKDLISQVDELTEVEPNFFKRLILEVIRFARSHDFEPHPDYLVVKKIFEDVDETTCEEIFTFGQDGEPIVLEHGCHDPHCDHDHA